MGSYLRPLNTDKLAGNFLIKALEVRDTNELGDYIQKLVTAENMLMNCESKDTLSSDDYRHIGYASDSDRKKLRKNIFDELVSMPLLNNDDEIKLGNGGVIPEGGLKNENQAYIVTGLPASGKSYFSTKIAHKMGAAIIDSDFAKRKFPEYSKPHGASIVHEESILVTFGLSDKYRDEPSLYEFMVFQNANLVIPKIGHDKQSICDIRDALKRKGYDVHLVYVSIDRVESTKRAFKRFEETGRYVPLSLIFDQYSNEPTITFYRLMGDAAWTSVCKISTLARNPSIVYMSHSEHFISDVIGGPSDV